MYYILDFKQPYFTFRYVQNSSRSLLGRCGQGSNWLLVLWCDIHYATYNNFGMWPSLYQTTVVRGLYRPMLPRGHCGARTHHYILISFGCWCYESRAKYDRTPYSTFNRSMWGSFWEQLIIIILGGNQPSLWCKQKQTLPPCQKSQFDHQHPELVTTLESGFTSAPAWSFSQSLNSANGGIGLLASPCPWRQRKRFAAVLLTVIISKSPLAVEEPLCSGISDRHHFKGTKTCAEQQMAKGQAEKRMIWYVHCMSCFWPQHA